MTQHSENNGTVNGHISAVSGLPLGMVIEGSVANGVEVKLDPGVSVEQIRVGTFVTLEGTDNRFFGVVTDVALGSTDPRMKFVPISTDDAFVAQALLGTVAFGSVSVLPQLTMPDVKGDETAPEAAKSIPSHFSRAFIASQDDVETVNIPFTFNFYGQEYNEISISSNGWIARHLPNGVQILREDSDLTI